MEKDALAALETYLDSVRAAYRDDPACSEICSDIEERVAELLLEKCSCERVVSIDMVNYVKGVIGEFGSRPAEEAAAEPEAADTDKLPRRLYRDIENRFLGGVCSGLAAYFDLDVVIFRVVFLGISLAGLFIDKHWSHTIGGIAFLAYFVLWICIPAAKTVEQKCRLTGKPMSAAGIASLERQRPVREGVHDARTSPAAHTLGRIFLIAVGCLMMLMGITGIICCAVYNLIPNVVHNYVDDIETLNIIDTMFSLKVTVSLIVATVLWAVWNIYAGTLLVFNLNAPKWRPGLAIFLCFIAACALSLYFIIRAALGVAMLI